MKFSTCLIFTFFSIHLFSQVGIGTVTPDASTLLDVSSSNKGVLLPKVALNSITDITTVSNPATGLLVYNTANVAGLNVGYTYWNGTRWNTFVDLNTESADWTLQGNDLSGGEFLGTTNEQSLQLRVNNNQIGLFAPNGGIAIGLNTQAKDNNSIAIGTNAKAINSNQALAIGYGADASAFQSTSIGLGSKASQDRSLALGNNSTASGQNSTALGLSATASAQNAMAMGNASLANKINTIALGNDAQAIGVQSISVGLTSRASSDYSAAFGTFANAASTFTAAFGYGAKATANSSTAFGAGAEASNNNATAFANNAVASGSGSTVVGFGSQASGLYASILGSNARASGDYSIAIGGGDPSAVNGAKAEGANAIAIGYLSKASAANSVVIGPNTSTNRANSIILGNGANVGIGTQNPQARLQVTGDLRYVDGNQANGKILMSDADGTATWQPNPNEKAYGTIYKTSTIALTTTGLKTITFGSNTGTSKNVSLQNTYIEVTSAGVYAISYTAAISSSNGTSRNQQFYLSTSTAAADKIAGSTVSLSTSDGGERNTSSKSIVKNLAAGTRIHLLVESTDGVSLLADENSLTVHRIE